MPLGAPDQSLSPVGHLPFQPNPGPLNPFEFPHASHPSPASSSKVCQATSPTPQHTQVLNKPSPSPAQAAGQVTPTFQPVPSNPTPSTHLSQPLSPASAPWTSACRTWISRGIQTWSPLISSSLADTASTSETRAIDSTRRPDFRLRGASPLTNFTTRTCLVRCFKTRAVFTPPRR